MEQKKQRGGRRPGAGAPIGNLNGYRTGNHSRRVFMVLVVLNTHPDAPAFVHELHHAGFFGRRGLRFNGNTKGVVRYLYARFFGGAEPTLGAIKCNQPRRRCRPTVLDTIPPPARPAGTDEKI
jgi:hypothetical protein